MLVLDSCRYKPMTLQNKGPKQLNLITHVMPGAFISCRLCIDGVECMKSLVNFNFVFYLLISVIKIKKSKMPILSCLSLRIMNLKNPTVLIKRSSLQLL